MLRQHLDNAVDTPNGRKTRYAPHSTARFVKSNLFFDRILNELCLSISVRIFPTPDTENRVICQ